MKDEKIDNEINSLVNQLKDSNSNNKQLQHPDSNVPLTPEEVEAFVVQNSAKLITHGLEVMDNVKDYIIASNDPESISALSDLIRASSSSIDTLNKLVVQNKRTATTLTAKQMDIDSKAIEIEHDPKKLVGTREEVFKKLLTDAVVIEETTKKASLSATPDL